MHTQPTSPVRQARRKANIDTAATLMLFSFILEHDYLRSHYRELKRRGWKFYVVAQSRGRCYYHDKVITIPTFAARAEPDYKVWYIAHEMAHAYAGHQAAHGPIFMMWLKIICPASSAHYELGYKPGNAAAAGISKTGVDLLTGSAL